MGVQPFHFGKNDFELGFGGDGQVHTARSIRPGPYVQYCQCEASEQKLGQKLGQKPESELKVIELRYCHHSICLLKTSIYKKECQNWKKNDQVMPNLMFLCQSGIWPILCQLMAILANLLDMGFKFVLPSIYINFDTQTNFEVNQTQISYYIIPKNTPKNHQSAISQNPIFSKCHSPKSLLLLHFSMNLSEIFRINVNMDFAHTNHGRFLI